jgi:hypothetical protein
LRTQRLSTYGLYWRKFLAQSTLRAADLLSESRVKEQQAEVMTKLKTIASVKAHLEMLGVSHPQWVQGVKYVAVSHPSPGATVYARFGNADKLADYLDSIPETDNPVVVGLEV